MTDSSAHPLRGLRAPDRVAVMEWLRRSSTANCALAVLLVLCVVLLMVAGRHLSFFFDEWDFALGRRGDTVGTYLDPHNGHLVLFAVVVYKVLFELVGLRHYWPYQAVDVALHVLCCWLLYMVTKPRLGPWLGLAPVALLLFMGSAYEDLLWPFQITFLGSVAGGLAALVLLDRHPRGADIGIAVMLIWSLSASAVGIAFVVATVAALLAQRSPVTRYWVVAAPLVMYGAWYAGWGTSEATSLASFLGAPQYIANAAGAASAGIAGFPEYYGPALTVVAVAGSVAALRHRGAARSPLLLAAVLGALTFWGLSAVVRSDVADPAASRYLYVGAVFFAVAVADASAGLRPGVIGSTVLAVLVAAAVVSNVGQLRQGERTFRGTDESVRASLEAVQLAAPVVAPDFVAEPQRAPQITAGPYLAAARQLGSPALTLTRLARAPLSLQVGTDGVLEQAERLVPSPVQTAAGDGPLDVGLAQADRVSSTGHCDRVSPTSAGDAFDLVVSPGRGLAVQPVGHGEVSAYVRRFALQFSEPPFAQLTTPEAIAFPVDLAPSLPWHVRLTSSTGFRVCGRAGP